MVNCAYKTENLQCWHKNVHTKDQVVTDTLCKICQFRADETNPEKMRSQLPIVEIQPYTKTEVAVSLGKSVIKNGIALVTGRQVYVPKEEYERRMAICSGCKHKKGNACDICSCNLPRKCRYCLERCPIASWVEYVPSGAAAAGGQLEEGS